MDLIEDLDIQNVVMAPTSDGDPRPPHFYRGENVPNGLFDDSSPLPEGAEKWLRMDNPRLVKLRVRYAELDSAVTLHSQWNSLDVTDDLSLPWFRGDNVYIWQHRQLKSDVRLKMYLALIDIESRDDLGLLSSLSEDGAFGCWTYKYLGRPLVSRDLLDSVNEINFLNKHIHIKDIPSLKILDVGAGYGRLAHRMCCALNNLESYDCVDAIPESTFLCDYYLNYRAISSRSRSIPLNRLHLLHANYDLAINIHSFSECTLSSIEWWLKRVSERRIPWLLIVPNDPEKLLSKELDGNGLDYHELVEAAGYTLEIKAPVYQNEELKDLIGVHDNFYLFRFQPK